MASMPPEPFDGREPEEEVPPVPGEPEPPPPPDPVASFRQRPDEAS